MLVVDSSPSIQVYPRRLALLGREEEQERDPTSTIAEVRALNAVMAMAASGVEALNVRVLVNSTLQARLQEDLFHRPEDFGIAAAMASLLGSDPQSFVPLHLYREKEWDSTFTECCVRAWIDTACGFPEYAISSIKRLRSRQDAEQPQVAEGGAGAVNRMAMDFWLQAIEALAVEDLTEARRLWERAIEIGSCFGTDSHLAISWTFVATFAAKPS
jgi:hypothetical protein